MVVGAEEDWKALVFAEAVVKVFGGATGVMATGLDEVLPDDGAPGTGKVLLDRVMCMSVVFTVVDLRRAGARDFQASVTSA